MRFDAPRRLAARIGIDRALLGAAALALAAAFVAPGWTAERQRFQEVVVLDITQSMNVEDEVLDGRPVSRLAFAKHALREALLQMPCGSRVGWGIFTEYRSFLLFAPVEVCANLSELRATLADIDGRMAWTGNSEIAKGLYSGLSIVKQLPERPSLVFVTDGHEAPPLNPRHRPRFDGTPGEASGVVVGVGQIKPSPIPKTDPQGRPLGYWAADEVVQNDAATQVRAGSVASEKLVDEGGDAPRLPDAPSGSEQLSSLHEAYLRLLSGETGLGFHRLDSADGLAAALTAPALARPAAVRVDARMALGGVALLLLLARQGWPIFQRLARRFRH